MLNTREAFFHLLFFDLLDAFVERGEMSAFEAALRKRTFIEKEQIATDELKTLQIARQQGKTLTVAFRMLQRQKSDDQIVAEAFLAFRNRNLSP